MKNKIVKNICVSVLLFCGILMSCSSSGSGNLHTQRISTEAKLVKLRPNTDTRAAEYMPNLTTALRKAGFIVTASGTAPYEVSVTFAGGGWGLNCSIVMYERGVPIVSGTGVNPGWGVWLARDRAYRGVFNSALKQFEKRLQ